MLIGTERKKLADVERLGTFQSGIMEDLSKDESTRELKFNDLEFTIKYGVDEKATSEDLKEGQILHTISTDMRDRDYEVMLPKGADFKWFKKNPVVLWGHNYYNNERYQWSKNKMAPVQYRNHLLIA